MDADPCESLSFDGQQKRLLAAWDEELLSLRLLDHNSADFDLSLTGFDPGEIDGWSHMPDEERANAAPPLPDHPASRTGDLWLCGNLRRRN